VGWLRKKHPQWSWKQIRRRYFGKDRLQENGIVLYNPASMRVERYRYRGAQISTPWNEATVDPTGSRYRRTSHQDDQFLERVQQTLA
jgi:RNA-directed DNA polymerase